jgi:phosphonate transport system substrate-binding protein
LKDHAKDIVFAFGDPASTSGNLYPRVGLLNAGINPEKDFKKVVFAGASQPATVLMIKAGKVNAGGFMQAAENRLLQKHKIDASDINVIWTSDPIPNSCYAVRKGLPEKLKKDIQAALVAMPTKDPELWANLLNLRRTMAITGTTFVAVKDSDYDGLRKYAAQVKDFNFLEK